MEKYMVEWTKRIAGKTNRVYFENLENAKEFCEVMGLNWHSESISAPKFWMANLVTIPVNETMGMKVPMGYTRINPE